MDGYFELSGPLYGSLKLQRKNGVSEVGKVSSTKTYASSGRHAGVNVEQQHKSPPQRYGV